jgi:hypothetical protein
LDLTLIRNWDFSLQANNDSYFDWTGFARLTYRMGGSRRRNVPDQMEQPMMRNEHIVRAHQTPEVAINPTTGTPWRVIHVNNANTASSGGTGSDTDPFTTLAAGNAAATNPWDIVFVRYGTGAAYDAAKGLNTTFSPLAANQYLIGNGAAFSIESACCGLVQIANGSGLRPVLTNPNGASINLTNGLVVNNFNIVGSQVGILGTGNLSSGISRPGMPPYGSPVGAAVVNNVSIKGNGTASPQAGVVIKEAGGEAHFTNTQITNMTTVGFLAADNNDATVTYQGSLTNNVATNGGVVSPLIVVASNTSSAISIAAGSAAAGSTVPNQVSDIGGKGIQILGNDADTAITIDNVSLKDNYLTAVLVSGSDASTTTITAGTGNGIIKGTPGAAIAVEFSQPTFSYTGPITNTAPSDGGNSYLLSVAENFGGVVKVQGALNDSANGIQVIGNNGTGVDVDGAVLQGDSPQGILIANNSPAAGDEVINFANTTITGATSAGVLINQTTETVSFANLNISLKSPSATGIQAIDSGAINATFNNSIVTSSTTAPAISVVNSGPIAMTFTTVSSAVPVGTNAAVNFTDSSGSFTVLSSFLVSGTQGTEAGDITPVPSPVTVSLPPP